MSFKKQKIVVAMSGGVDSSTVAAILNAEGHEVIGVTLQLYDYGMAVGKKGACCAGQDIYDAQMAAEKIGIPHYVLNYESIFKQEVIEDFADSYLKGETPIPCVKCNQSVKFRDLFKVAKDLGADALATGHYVQKKVEDGKGQLHRGSNQLKDQSYFLFATTQEQLDYLMFPIGHLTKDETRSLARQFGLEVSDKPDSQDICFVPDGDYGAVIKKMRPNAFEPGKIVHINGQTLGEHEGIINYTVGQRRGIGIAYQEPLYVIKIDPTSKTVFVGEKEALKSCEVNIRDANLLEGNIVGREYTFKLRSAHKGIHGRIVEVNEDNSAKIELYDGYYGVTPGQACVFYDDTRLIGGGWIV